MLLRQCEIVTIDFETTGAVAGYPDEPWEIGMALVAGGCLQAGQVFRSLIHVGRRPFNPYAPGRHARLRDELAQAPPMSQLWPLIAQWTDRRVVAAHHAATERRILDSAFPLHALGPWVDTLRIARLAYPELRDHSLATIVTALGLADRLATLCPGGQPHDALFDALAAALILETVLAQPAWAEVTVSALAS